MNKRWEDGQRGGSWEGGEVDMYKGGMGGVLGGEVGTKAKRVAVGHRENYSHELVSGHI